MRACAMVVRLAVSAATERSFSRGLTGAARQQQGAHAMFRSDGAAGQHQQAGVHGQGSDGNKAQIGGAGGEPVGAFGGHHPVHLVAG